CRACDFSFHILAKCYHAFPELAPEGFEPRKHLVNKVKNRLETDEALRSEVERLGKKPRKSGQPSELTTIATRRRSHGLFRGHRGGFSGLGRFDPRLQPNQPIYQLYGSSGRRTLATRGCQSWGTATSTSKSQHQKAKNVSYGYSKWPVAYRFSGTQRPSPQSFKDPISPSSARHRITMGSSSSNILPSQPTKQPSSCAETSSIPGRKGSHATFQPKPGI
ncbi:hypothetical protein C8A00DRAFT_19550, partial [Chaetomidium leptoderma]